MARIAKKDLEHFEEILYTESHKSDVMVMWANSWKEKGDTVKFNQFYRNHKVAEAEVEAIRATLYRLGYFAEIVPHGEKDYQYKISKREE